MRKQLLWMLLTSLIPSHYSRASAQEAQITKGSYPENNDVLLPMDDELLDSRLKQLSEVVREDQSVTLTLYSDIKRPKSLASIRAKRLRLKAFHNLVEAGMDPSKIIFMEKADSNKAQVILSVTERLAAKTKKITPDPNQTTEANSYVLYFASGSPDPLESSEKELNAFLKGVGLPGHDALSIEGQTDPVGGHDYNVVLSELRALRVYEILTRQGLPPYRVSTSSQTSDNVPSSNVANDAKESRRVTLRWIKDEKAAAQAAAVEVPAVVPAPVIEQPVPVVPSVQPQIIPQKPEVLSSPSRYAVTPFVGAAIPMGDLREETKAGVIYGLKLEKLLLDYPQASVSVGLSGAWTKLPPKESDLSGDLKIQSYGLDGRITYGNQAFRPVLGLGAGLENWTLNLHQNSSGLTNDRNGQALGLKTSLGMDCILTSLLSIEPSIGWHHTFGDFAQSYLETLINLRWRI